MDDRDYDDYDMEQPRRPRGMRQTCDFVDFKDIPTLRKYLNAQGKIHSRKRTGTCAKCQRLVKAAVKRARFMGIMSYTG